MLKKTCFKQLCKLLPKHLNMSKVIAYDNIIAILLEGVKFLSDEVKELKNKIEK